MRGVSAFALTARCPIAGSHEFKGFMSKQWFTDRNAGALRSFLRSIILDLFVTQVRFVPLWFLYLRMRMRMRMRHSGCQRLSHSLGVCMLCTTVSAPLYRGRRRPEVLKGEGKDTESTRHSGCQHLSPRGRLHFM